jgi:hypothetical protein
MTPITANEKAGRTDDWPHREPHCPPRFRSVISPRSRPLWFAEQKRGPKGASLGKRGALCFGASLTTTAGHHLSAETVKRPARGDGCRARACPRVRSHHFASSHRQHGMTGAMNVRARPETTAKAASQAVASRLRAATCEEIAERCGTPPARESYQRSAAAWLRLAALMDRSQGCRRPSADLPELD